MNIIIVVILIIAACGVVGISADILKNKKTKASLEKILVDLGTDVVDLIQDAVSILTLNISHFKDVNEFKVALSDTVATNIIDALKKEGKYDESILSENNLSTLVNYIFTKYKDKLKIDEVYENAKKSETIDEPVKEENTTDEKEISSETKEDSTVIPESIQAEFTETKAPTTVEEVKESLTSTPDVAASITLATSVTEDNSMEENPLVSKAVEEEKTPETTDITKDLDEITSDSKESDTTNSSVEIEGTNKDSENK